MAGNIFKKFLSLSFREKLGIFLSFLWIFMGMFVVGLIFSANAFILKLLVAMMIIVSVCAIILLTLDRYGE